MHFLCQLYSRSGDKIPAEKLTCSKIGKVLPVNKYLQQTTQKPKTCMQNLDNFILSAIDDLIVKQFVKKSK